MEGDVDMAELMADDDADGAAQQQQQLQEQEPHQDHQMVGMVDEQQGPSPREQDHERAGGQEPEPMDGQQQQQGVDGGVVGTELEPEREQPVQVEVQEAGGEMQLDQQAAGAEDGAGMVEQPAAAPVVAPERTAPVPAEAAAPEAVARAGSEGGVAPEPMQLDEGDGVTAGADHARRRSVGPAAAEPAPAVPATIVTEPVACTVQAAQPSPPLATAAAAGAPAPAPRPAAKHGPEPTARSVTVVTSLRYCTGRTFG